MRDTHPALLILAPAHECRGDFEPWRIASPEAGLRPVGDVPFNAFVDAFVEAGVDFPFDADQRLPADLPDALDGVRCLVVQAERLPELDAGRLAAFREQGGYVWVPNAREGQTHDEVRAMTARAIATADLPTRSSVLRDRLQAVDDDRLLSWWVGTIGAQAEVLSAADAGWAWGDPVAYHLYWPAWEAAAELGRPELMEPLWEMMRRGLDPALWPDTIHCGKRFALRYAAHCGDSSIVERVVREARESALGRHSWRMDGLVLNLDLEAPEAVDRDAPPRMVREHAWVWPEPAGNLGDSLGYVSRVTGDASFAATAVKQVLTTHWWCFAPELGVWYHVGRSGGPERRSAPWGRGNGWFLYGVRGLLEDLPEVHPARPELVAALAAGLEGLLRFQAPSGLWHNVLDAVDGSSREETSGAWMFINTYARAYWRGWLRDERIPGMVVRAWQGLKGKLWRGLPLAHCTGTSYMFDRQAYLARPQTRFLGHPLLLALIERRRLERCLNGKEMT